jgi:hypothetical protein
MAFKGQAAIEYLATYGWMLAAVAMVSGIVYSSTGAAFCQDSVSGFTGQSLRVEDFGMSADSADMMLSVENQDSQGFYNQLKEIQVKNRDTGETIVASPDAQIITSGETEVFNINGFEKSNSCNTYNVELTYDRGDILPSQKATGTITTNAEIFSESYDPFEPSEDTSYLATTIEDTNSPVEEGETLEVDYNIENTGTKSSTQTIEFTYDGTVEESLNVELEPGDSSSGTFTYTTGSTGDYTVEVRSNNETSSDTVTVQEPSQDFVVSNIDAPDTGYQDTEIEASAEITSNGPSSSDNAQLRLGSDITGAEGADYEVIEFQQVEVEDETKTVTFNTVLDSAEVDAGTGQEIGIEYEGRTSSKIIDIYQQPEIVDFTVSDNSNRGRGARYDIEWEATDPANNLEEANITVNNVEQATGLSGTTEFGSGDYQETFTFRFQSSYSNGFYLCREVTDQADGNEATGYSDCS